MAGYEDANDAEGLSQDPVFRLMDKVCDRGVAWTSRLRTFETEMLAEAEYLAGLARINRELIGKVEALVSPQRVVPDIDSNKTKQSAELRSAQPVISYTGRSNSQ